MVLENPIGTPQRQLGGGARPFFRPQTPFEANRSPLREFAEAVGAFQPNLRKAIRDEAKKEIEEAKTLGLQAADKSTAAQVAEALALPPEEAQAFLKATGLPYSSRPDFIASYQARAVSNKIRASFVSHMTDPELVEFLTNPENQDDEVIEQRIQQHQQQFIQEHFQDQNLTPFAVASAAQEMDSVSQPILKNYALVKSERLLDQERAETIQEVSDRAFTSYSSASQLGGAEVGVQQAITNINNEVTARHGLGTPDSREVFEESLARFLSTVQEAGDFEDVVNIVEELKEKHRDPTGGRMDRGKNIKLLDELLSQGAAREERMNHVNRLRAAGRTEEFRKEGSRLVTSPEFLEAVEALGPTDLLGVQSFVREQILQDPRMGEIFEDVEHVDLYVNSFSFETAQKLLEYQNLSRAQKATSITEAMSSGRRDVALQLAGTDPELKRKVLSWNLVSQEEERRLIDLVLTEIGADLERSANPSVVLEFEKRARDLYYQEAAHFDDTNPEAVYTNLRGLEKGLLEAASRWRQSPAREQLLSRAVVPNDIHKLFETPGPVQNLVRSLESISAEMIEAQKAALEGQTGTQSDISEFAGIMERRLNVSVSRISAEIERLSSDPEFMADITSPAAFQRKLFQSLTEVPRGSSKSFMDGIRASFRNREISSQRSTLREDQARQLNSGDVNLSMNQQFGSSQAGVAHVELVGEQLANTGSSELLEDLFGVDSVRQAGVLEGFVSDFEDYYGQFGKGFRNPEGVEKAFVFRKETLTQAGLEVLREVKVLPRKYEVDDGGLFGFATRMSPKELRTALQNHLQGKPQKGQLFQASPQALKNLHKMLVATSGFSRDEWLSGETSQGENLRDLFGPPSAFPFSYVPIFNRSELSEEIENPNTPWKDYMLSQGFSDEHIDKILRTQDKVLLIHANSR